jgi:hypothetical protein
LSEAKGYRDSAPDGFNAAGRADASGRRHGAVYDHRLFQYGAATMTDTGLPTYLNRGLSLTHAELCTQNERTHSSAATYG